MFVYSQNLAASSWQKELHPVYFIKNSGVDLEKATKLQLHLRKRLEQAILKHQMLQAGDRLLVGVSGGSDSLTLLKLLTGPMLFVPRPEFILAVHVDLGFEEPGAESVQRLQTFLQQQGFSYHLEKSHIGPLAHSDFNRKASPCFLCSRLRRRKLFEVARDFRCNKLALAHNKDDVIETLLLNIFYAREISTMIPRQPFFGGEFDLIRPFAYIEENLLKRFARESGLPVIPNPCPTAKKSKRKVIKELLANLEKNHRGIKENIFKAMRHVKPDYLLEDQKMPTPVRPKT
jgi:tRNA 2-thiocytidine biosynthesis protein TtcA